MPNITDKYDPKRLEQAQEIIQKAARPDDPPQSRELARESVISMADAISLAERFFEKNELKIEELEGLVTARQLSIVGNVSLLRKTQEGRDLTDLAEKNDVWLAIDEDIPKAIGQWHADIKMASLPIPRMFGSDPAVTGQRVSVALEMLDALKTLDHEMTHALHTFTGRDKPPEDLSDYDLSIYLLAGEAHAQTHSAVQMAKMAGKPLTDAEKRKVFSKDVLSSEWLAENYNFPGSSRANGRKLTMDEFADAFGVIGGEDGNFLKGHYADPADIFTPEKPDSGRVPSLYYHARYEAERPFVPLSDIPVGPDTRRFIGKDGKYIIDMTMLPEDRARVELFHSIPYLEDTYVSAAESVLEDRHLDRFHEAYSGPDHVMDFSVVIDKADKVQVEATQNKKMEGADTNALLLGNAQRYEFDAGSTTGAPLMLVPVSVIAPRR